MRVLVTGGAGFIGSHLVDLLITQGHEVTVIDNLSNGNLSNLEQHKGKPQLRFVNHDIADHDAIKDLFTHIDWVFHLAALADIVPSIERPMDYHHSNVDGTISVLEASRKAGVKRFIYAASSSCYGIPDTFPTPETAAIRPQYPYALTKNIAEQYVMHWGHVYFLPAMVLRMFNIYGPRSRTSGTYGAVFGVFLAQKLAGKPLTIVGDGKQTRDFTYVGDAVRAYVAAAESDLLGEIMNIGSGGTYSVNRLCELIGGEPVYIPKRPGEPDCTFADTSKISRLLGWKPKITLEEGVKIMLDNIDYWRKAPVWDKDSIAAATKDWFKYLGGK
jgi:UDP-glucose 4-epimerase